MSPGQTPSEPTELVYQPKPSWAPALLAGGLTLLIVGLFTWYPYAVAGGLVALFALRNWVSTSLRRIERLPRRQRVSSAPIPLSGVVREKRSEQA
jgi:hypothetical protein